VSFNAPQKINDLYFIAGLAPRSSGPRVLRLATMPQLLYERIGHPGPTQLSLLAKHSTGLPSKLTAGLQPINYCQACKGGKIKRALMGPTSDTDSLLPGTRLYVDFGFICASSADFGTTPGNRVVTSYDGNVCGKAHHMLIFCQASQSPPIFMIERFLVMHGLETGPRLLYMDRGCELWCSNQLHALYRVGN
jgi:hypothetical protein